MAAEPAEPENIRFPAEMVAAAKLIAAREGKAVGQWIREAVSKEIVRRAGRCPACGQIRSR